MVEMRKAIDPPLEALFLGLTQHKNMVKMLAAGQTTLDEPFVPWWHASIPATQFAEASTSS
jgi:hypothetical protein